MKTIKYIAAFLPLASLLVSCNDDFFRQISSGFRD